MMFPKFSPGMSLSPYGGSPGGSPQPFQFPGGQGQPLPFDPRGGGLQKPGMPGMQPPGMPPPGMQPPPMGMPQAQSQFGNYQQQAQIQPQAMGQQQMGMPQPRATFNPPPFAELGLGGMSIGKGRQPTLDGIGGLGGAMRGFPGRAMF
jgi:hypothetical protein